MKSNLIRMAITAILLLVFASPAQADLIAEWGIIPIGSETSFTFTPSDASTNFTDQYSFSLLGTTEINFSLSSFLGTCTKGCGSPAITYGIYDANGGLISGASPVTLGAGSYVFQIKGTGMGAGNKPGSGGLIDFYSAPAEVVSPAPEPGGWLLLLAGLGLVVGLARRQAKFQRTGK